ncbi:MAG: flagellar basal body-associated FliL family protein [Chloroflexi bacterium]|nr:flagellar basal body-associated FliL family protein [Chloroflexota bacterium]
MGALLKNKIVLGGIVGGVIGIAVIAFLVMGSGGPPEEADAAAGAPKATAAKSAKSAKSTGAAAASKFGPSYVIKDRIVNLADPGGRRYLRYSVAIEFEPHAEAAIAPPARTASGYQNAVYEDAGPSMYVPITGGASKDSEKEFLASIKKYIPAMEDAVTIALSSKTFADLSSVEGKEQAKKEIKDRIQRLLGDAEHVTNVYFTEFVIQ